MAKYTAEETPLHLATQQRQLDRVRALLDTGMKPDARDRYHVTPLMIAVRFGYGEIAELLIERGADVNAKDRGSAIEEGGLRPLHYACDAGRVAMARLLLKNGADPDCSSQDWNTPFSTALYIGNKPIAECLLEHGAKADGPEKCRWPPIVAAAARNDLPMVVELLRRGANPNRIGGNGSCALSETGSIECAAQLLAYGADVNLVDSWGNGSPLLNKLIAGSDEMIRLLVQSGAKVNSTSKNTTAPILIVAMHPRIEIAEILNEAGADVNALHPDGMTALDICLYAKPMQLHYAESQRMAEWLRKRGGKLASELMTESGEASVKPTRAAAARTSRRSKKGGPSNDGFDIVREAQTDGANYELDTNAIIERLQQWSGLCKFRVTEAGHDNLTIEFVTLPEDIKAFVQDLYDFCPDLIDQGIPYFPSDAATADSGSAATTKVEEHEDLENDDYGLEMLKRQLQQTKQVRLWWD
ncbi:MAG: ankyrin repeat domain-containing protein [Verrucomicrobia bacterium]|nr:ankyrin repeat domain-containing protein [Verrucomicrobiota bacterium]